MTQFIWMIELTRFRWAQSRWVSLGQVWRRNRLWRRSSNPRVWRAIPIANWSGRCRRPSWNRRRWQCRCRRQKRPLAPCSAPGAATNCRRRSGGSSRIRRCERCWLRLVRPSSNQTTALKRFIRIQWRNFIKRKETQLRRWTRQNRTASKWGPIRLRSRWLGRPKTADRWRNWYRNWAEESTSSAPLCRMIS